MLGKLIKHEFKAVNRLMIPLHLGLILITIVGRFYIQFTVLNNPLRYTYTRSSNVWYGIMDATLILFYVIALIAIAAITYIYLNIIRPRKNLFTDEGYLMHTLPVSAAAHIWSKLIVSLIWQCIDVVLVILSVLGMLVNVQMLREFPESFSMLMSGFSEVFGVSAGVGIPVYLILFLVDSVSGILLFYMCIAVGHSFNSHKILSSVGIYVGVYVVLNLISVIFAGLSGISYMSSSSFSIGIYGAGLTSETFWFSCIFSLILSVVTGVASYLTANYFMTKRLNLE